MSDEEIAFLAELSKTKQLAWIADYNRICKIKSIRNHPTEEDEGVVAFFDGASYISLCNTEPEDFIIIEEINYK